MNNPGTDVCNYIFKADQSNSPTHINECDCTHHTGICKECNRVITHHADDQAYGHHRGRRDETERCSHRPESVDPDRTMWK